MMRLSYSLLVVFLFFQFSCRKSEKMYNGCSCRASEKVYLGQLDFADIEEISFLKSSQRGLYPVPDWEGRKDELLIIEDEVFFKKFVYALSENSFSDGEYIPKDVRTLHILVKLINGPDAYLCGFSGKGGFMLSPMFEHDSYGGINNAVLRLFCSESGSF